MSVEDFYDEWCKSLKIVEKPHSKWMQDFAVAYAAHEREKMLNVSVETASSIYEEAIKPHLSDYRLNNKAASMIFGQALLNHLKQNR